MAASLLCMAGWFYALLARPDKLKWRGTVINLKEHGDE